MGLEEIQSDLFSLRQLYGLLRRCGDCSLGTELENPHILLDKKALQLLKNLLDDAAERIWKTYLEVIAVQHDISDAPCYSQSVQAKAASSSRPPLPPDVQKPFLRTSVLNYKSDCTSHTTAEEKDECILKRSQDTTSGVSKETSVSSNKPGSTKKRCRHCERKSSLQNQVYKEAKIPSEDTHQEQQHLQQIRGGQANGLPEMKDFDYSFTSLSMGTPKPEIEFNHSGHLEKPDWENDFAKEVSDSIKQIESHILAFQLNDPIKNASPKSALFKKNIYIDPVKQMLDRPSTSSQMSHVSQSFFDGNETQSWKKVPPTSRHENLSDEVQLMQNYYRKPSLAGYDLTSQMTNPLPCPSVKSMVKRIESLSLPRSENIQMKSYVHGLRVPLSQDDSGKNPVVHEKAPSQSIPVHNPLSQKGTNRNGVRPKPYVRPDNKLNQNFTYLTNRSKKDPHHMMVNKPTMLDQKSSEILVSPTSHISDFGRVEKGTKRKPRLLSTKKIIPHHQELEESSSISFPSSSTWSTQSNSFSNKTSESEEYPAPSHRRRARQYRSPSLYSSPESEEIILPTKTCKSKQGKTSQKGIGRLRRFKNKLGLIFHHHHHHHHHHHNDKHCNNHSDTSSSHLQRSTWKRIHRKIFHGKNKAGINVELGAEKPKKSAVVKVSKDHRVGYLHALVEGLFKHLRRSKKSKRSKGEIRRISKNIKTHGHNNKMVKRFHWWQMFRRHGGMRLPKRRGRVKLGLANKRPKLKMK